jgi:hypothetical protein
MKPAQIEIANAVEELMLHIDHKETGRITSWTCRILLSMI